MIQSRIERIFARCPAEVDTIVLQNAAEPFVDATFYYVTGLKRGIFEGCTAVLRRKGRPSILVSRLEEESAREREEDLDITVFSSAEENKQYLRDLLHGNETLGVNAKELTYARFLALADLLPQVRWVNISDAVSRTRLVKDEEEISLLRVSCRITSEVADLIPELLREGMTETELSAHLSYEMRKRGGTADAFSVIVSFGVGTAQPHYVPGDIPLRRGDLVLADFGCVYSRYRSDITRTYMYGPATERHRRLYGQVLGAQRTALETIHAGVKGGDCHQAAEDFLYKEEEYRGRFTHRLGHSLGLATHDGYSLHPSVDITLEEGMVFTVEPGLYFPDFGGVRIEDDVVVTRDGCEILTTAQKDKLIEVD